MQTGYFITGTDTGAGKTLCSLALMEALKKQGLTVAGMKPVAAGCYQTAEGLRNDDAEKLLKASSRPLAYDLINPYAFEPPIAPHIAAEQRGVEIKISQIQQHYNALSIQVDRVIVEGAGGWLVPINAYQTLADVACALQLPIIMVVGMRLGCINHAMLTYNSIQATGIKIVAWIANQVDGDMAVLTENVDYLASRFDAPLLGLIPYASSPSPNCASMHLDIGQLNT